MLVVTRKDGESVVIRHAGEELVVYRDGRNLKFDGPESFSITRSETIGRAEPLPSEHEHVGADCFFRSENNNLQRKGVVTAVHERQSGIRYDVRLGNGASMKNIKAEYITLVSKVEPRNVESDGAGD